MGQQPCPLTPTSEVFHRYECESRPDDGKCHYCGSLLPDTFMERLEAGTVILTPTDKNYKVYVTNNGGENFRRSYRVDEPAKVGQIVKDPLDQTQWLWATREEPETKFCFEHLSEGQKKRFVELLNAKKLKIDCPGYFYRLPFFVTSEAK